MNNLKVRNKRNYSRDKTYREVNTDTFPLISLCSGFESLVLRWYYYYHLHCYLTVCSIAAMMLVNSSSEQTIKQTLRICLSSLCASATHVLLMINSLGLQPRLFYRRWGRCVCVCWGGGGFESESEQVLPYRERNIISDSFLVKQWTFPHVGVSDVHRAEEKKNRLFSASDQKHHNKVWHRDWLTDRCYLRFIQW